MIDQNLLIFLLITLSGFLVVFIGARNKSAYRRHIIVTGVTILHIGIFGILYIKLPFIPFLALVLLVLSTFTLIDPIKVGRFLPDRFCPRLGFFLLLAAAALFLQYLIGFPAWLWTFPIAIFFMPYTLPTWKARKIYFQLFALLLIVIFLGVCGYAIYGAYRPEHKNPTLDAWLQPLSDTSTTLDHLPFLKPKQIDKTAPNTTFLNEHPFQDLEIIQNPLSKTPPSDTPPVTAPPVSPFVEPSTPQLPTASSDTESQPLQNGPLLDSLRDFDQKYLELKHDYQKLQDKYRDALQDLERLKQENDALKNKTPPTGPSY